ncbi:DUF1877 family protein [Nostoc sp. CENA67]|uniref:DUF1877 family protein n=1 Tax=Amazonocrinis nigriterrae CENA67 TaxID=2794033 RepID=A0A8J7HNR2_9NOST|nr:DUF1877 family protein [Amazonocrinis nigriterrae]MBH8562737.1 DUF1877 family protein [Amazonocrinis nigriterrae CENA67]
MGIELSYRRLTPEEFERLHNDEAYASIYFGDDLETDEEIHAYFEALRVSDRYLDLDKYWRSLYFLFTGEFPYDDKTNSETWLKNMFMGGKATQWEATYGMVRYFTVSEVNDIAEVLNHVSVEDLQNRLNQLFESSKSRAYMEPHHLDLYAQLVNFFSKAAQQSEIILLSFD